METLQLLALALGLASLAGINLYLSVFLTGLAIHEHWIVLLPRYESLAILAHPAIIAVAGALYFIEFVADKIPWVDSAWDSLHTVIRPIGGALLALRVLGTPHPAFDVIIALLAGSVSLLAHGVKASTRLAANASPEPFSNIALSLAEDAFVVGGLILLHLHPFIALGVLGLLVAAVLYFAPKIFRATRVKLWLIWKKLNVPAGGDADSEPLPSKLAPKLDEIFAHFNLLGEHIDATAPCISVAAPRIPGNVFGCLVATREEPRKIYFIAKRRLGKIAETIDLAGYDVAHEPKFLSDNLVLTNPAAGPRYAFLFDRGHARLARDFAAFLKTRLAAPRAETSSVKPPAG